MKNQNFIFILGIFLTLSFTSCEKEGLDGSAKLSGSVLHHDTEIPHAVVYIKFDANEFPGTDLSLYDSSTESDHHGGYSISNLGKGNYYLYAVGYDSTIIDSVFGGIPIEIKKGETKTSDIPVVE